jgi:hypothetical protein
MVKGDVIAVQHACIAGSRKPMRGDRIHAGMDSLPLATSLGFRTGRPAVHPLPETLRGHWHKVLDVADVAQPPAMRTAAAHPIF